MENLINTRTKNIAIWCIVPMFYGGFSPSLYIYSLMMLFATYLYLIWKYEIKEERSSNIKQSMLWMFFGGINYMLNGDIGIIETTQSFFYYYLALLLIKPMLLNAKEIYKTKTQQLQQQ